MPPTHEPIPSPPLTLVGCRLLSVLLPLQKLAAAAVFLACKLEECTKVRVREVVMVFDRLWKRRDNASLTLLEPGTKVSNCGRGGSLEGETDGVNGVY